MSRLRGEAGRFLIVGVTTVLIDFAVYRALLAAGAPPAPAKAASFIAGTIFAYFANRHWTFQGMRKRFDGAEILRFAAVYAASLLANVTVNGIVLHLLGRAEMTIAIAFLCATGLSAVMNFLGMKLFVFRAAEP